MRFLLVDRITHLVPGVSVRGLKHVTYDDFYLEQTASGVWRFVPSLIGETLGQLAAWNVMMSCDFTARPVAGVVASASWLRAVHPGETLCLEATLDALDASAVQYHGEARVGDELVCRLEGALGPLLPMSDFIDGHVVRRQFDEINRPEFELRTPAKVEASIARVTDLTLKNCAGFVHTPPMVFDTYVAYEPGVRLVALKHITRAAAYFADHFPNKPVLPMSVLIECFMHLADELLQRAGIVFECASRTLRRIKMSDFVYPGDVVQGSVTLKQHDSQLLVFTCRADVNAKRVAVLEIRMMANEHCI